MEKWTVRSFLWAFAFVGISTWAASLVTHGFKNSPIHWVGLLSIGLLVLGGYWPKIATRLGERPLSIINAIASDPRVWLGLVALALVTSTAWSILLAVQRDQQANIVNLGIRPMIAAIERYVMPRDLNATQMWQVALILRQHTAVPVTLRAQMYDREAMEFAGALSQGLAAGYWPTGDIEQVDGLQDGLRLLCNQVSGDPTNMKRPLEILADAMHRAGVQIDSSGSNSAGGIAIDECFIEIGSRRRDGEAMPVKMTIRKIESPDK